MKLIVTLFLIVGWSYDLDTNDPVRRIVSDDLYNYTFFVTSKNNNSTADFKEYFWYKTGSVHSSVGGVDGQVLHGAYKKTYRNNGLAEQGEFYYGLKIKTWKTWYENGKVEKIINWQKGVLSGNYEEFDQKGKIVLSGKYRNNKKHGIWINHQAKDTSYFKKGKKVVKEELKDDEKVKKKKNSDKKSLVTKTKEFFVKTFKKKTPEEKEKIKKEKEIRKKQREIERKKKELERKNKKSSVTS